MTTVLSRYHLQGRLGSGGMAEVWLARASGPSGFEKQVVVKRILPQLAGDPTIEALFRAEARIASRLDHPNLLHVFDFGQEPDGSLVMVMELIDGASLRTVVRAVGPDRFLDSRVVAKLIAQVCEGLHAAHELKDEKGISLNLVHRDISPENILLARSGAVKVADFGIARLDREVQLTSPDTFRGKIGYASPEQIMCQPVTRQSDVWAIGVTLFEVLTGQKPFAADTEAELASATVYGHARRLEELRPDCPLAIADIVSKCLSADLAERWPHCQELGKQLEDFVSWTGAPVRLADLGAILSQLDIKPHTVVPGEPASFSADPSLALDVETSAFEPPAALAADGSLHLLETRGPPSVRVAPPKTGLEPNLTGSEHLQGSLGQPQDRLASRQQRFERLEVDPQKQRSEPAPATPSRPTRFGPTSRRFGLAIGAIALAGLAIFGVTELALSRTRSATHGTLLIDSVPSGAQVTVNGEPVGQTPWAGDNPAGLSTSIELYRTGFSSATIRLDGGTDWMGTVKLIRKK
jgi:eukaryotic-like serine/threonine-protein kinase